MPLYKNLTLRYVIALLLIAIVILMTYSILMWQLRQNENDAYIVNISGMQRMLSQRVALFAEEVSHAKNSEEAGALIEQMRGALEKMRHNHQQLTTGVYERGFRKAPSETIQKIYFSSNGLDEKVQNYINMADSLLNIYEAQGVEGIRQSDLIEEITATARDGILADLNGVVFQYQQESEVDIAFFKKLETMFFILGIGILLMEVLFIFRPMVRDIVNKTEKLEAANAELTEFAYRISHDLRAPIVSSLGLVNVIRMFHQQGNEKQMNEAIDHIEISMTRLNSLIDDVINLTKMKQQDIVEEETDLSVLVDQIFSSLENMEEMQNIEVSKNIAVKEPVMVAGLYLRQTLENLISNSVKYYDPETKKPYISITAEHEGQQCIISIKDNGLGIPEKYRENVFEMFKRFHPTVSYGSGLGLYLVKQNASALQGEILYNPTEDGTEFIVKFPFKKVKED